MGPFLEKATMLACLPVIRLKHDKPKDSLRGEMMCVP
jgi:hypothetical protein